MTLWVEYISLHCCLKTRLLKDGVWWLYHTYHTQQKVKCKFQKILQVKLEFWDEGVMFKYLLHCAIHSTLSEFYFLILSQLSSFECRFLLTAVWAQACHLSFGSRFQIPNCSSFLLRPIGAYIQRTVLRRVNCLVASLSLFSLSLVELREIDHLTKKWKPLQRKLSSKHTPLPRSMLPHLHHHQRLLTLL